MARHCESVYEALNSGLSGGLLTVSGARSPDGAGIGEGKWRCPADIKADAERNKAEAAKKAYKAPEEVAGPPKLRRAPQSGDQTSPAPPSSTASSSAPAPNAPATQASSQTKENPPATSSNAPKNESA